MRNALRLLLAAAIAAPALALAQASVQIRLDLPVVLPRLVVVSPGVQVVPDVQEEVFYTDGWYWVRHDGGWYRSRSHRAGWFPVPPGRVPRRLAGLPPGHYRRWHPPPPAPRPAPAAWRPPPAPRPEPAYPPPHGDHGDHGDRREEHGKHHGGHGHGGDEGNGHGHGDHD